MKFSVEKESFLSAVAKTSRSVAQKSSIPVLEGILIRAEGEKVSLTGYDLEIAISCEVEAKIIREGGAVISAKLLGDICRATNGATIDIDCSDIKIEITSGSVFYEISSMNIKDYPELPRGDTVPAATINGMEFKYMIDKTIFACNQNDKRPVNTGELFEIKDNKLTLVALDGYRLAVCSKNVSKAEEDISIIIPYKTMQEMSRLINDGIENITVCASRYYVLFICNEFSLLSRLIEGDFVDYKKVIPDGVKSNIVVDVKEFTRCIERASLVISERIRNPLRITFDESGIHVSCKTALGSVNDNIECEFEGLPLEIGFNNRYLLDALRACGCEKVNLEIIDSITAVKLLSNDKSDEFLYLVLPVRFKVSAGKTED